MHGDQTWIGLLIAAIGALVCLYLAFRFLRLARIIEDTPTARIRSAHQGYVELEGEVQPGPDGLLHGPLTGRPCCWYRYAIEKRGDKHWRTLEKGVSEPPFVLRDATGVCLVEPAGAEVTASERSVWYGTTRRPKQRDPARRPVAARGLGSLAKHWNSGGLFGGRFRYTEEYLQPGDTLYALGAFSSRGELQHRQARAALSRQLLRAWKKNPSNLLARFDRNGDGHIDAAEWEQARSAAERQAATGYKVSQRDSIPHRLSKGASRQQPFLLSALPQFSLVRRYQRYTLWSLAGFAIAAAAALWLMFQP